VAKRTVERVDKRMRELAIANGVPAERSDEAVKAFAKMLVGQAGMSPDTIALGDSALDKAAMDFFAQHASQSESDDPVARKASLAPRVGKPVGLDPSKLSWK
jgi:hypothetical protein